MDRISVRGLATAIRLIREPVVVTYSYPRSHPLYGAGEECGAYVPMPIWRDITSYLVGMDEARLLGGDNLGFEIKLPDKPSPVEGKRPFMDEDA